jgi:uncharacterized repeat protein (TIGR01451 family)
LLVKNIIAVAVVCLSSTILCAEISVTDRSATLRRLSDPSLQAKHDAKKSKRQQRLRTPALTLHPHATGAGDVSLIDASGLEYFISTNITAFQPFSSGSSASGAASEANFVAPVVASTMNGGTTTTVLDGMFDGYNSICVSLTAALGPCRAGNPSYAFYYQTGTAPWFDLTVPGVPSCTNRQLVFPPKSIGALLIQRKVFVPNNDQFIRWVSFFTNNSDSPLTFTMTTANNLGSDEKTVITGSSSGDTTAQLTDTWVATFQNFSVKRSTEPRIGHVLQGVGAPTPLSGIHFLNGDDRPYWTYTITLAPGQTKAILNFATGQGSKAEAAAKAAALALLPSNATQCLSATELGQVTNFLTVGDLSISQITASPKVFGGDRITYTLAVSNLSAHPASEVSVRDTLPPGSTYIEASGSSWSCNPVAGVVTCTQPATFGCRSVAGVLTCGYNPPTMLAPGAAEPITLTIFAPNVSSPGTLSNIATVTSASGDAFPENNSSTATVAIEPGPNLPALSTWTLMLLAAMLAMVALARRT